MRTLPANVLNSYMKRGKKSRVFVEIPDMGMFLGTAAETIDGNSFENKLNPCGTITWDAPLFSGMGSISNVTIKNLEIGRDISLCEKAEIVPQGDGETGKAGSGRLVSDNYGDYADIRKVETGNFDTVSVIVGRRRYSGAPLYGYSVYRAFLQFKIPDDPVLTSCEEAALFLTGLGNYSDTDFELYVLKGNWTLYNTGDMFNDFDGWSDTEGTYNGTVLNEKFTSYGYSSTDTNRIIFNRDGLKWIEDNAGGTLRLMILSKNDYLGNTASDPLGDEYLMFGASSARLKINYNTKNLTNSTAKVYLAYDPVPSMTSEMFLRWTGVVDKWKINEKTIDLELKQDNRKQDVYVPENIITDSVFSSVPDKNIGEPYPVVIGDVYGAAYGLHKTGIGIKKIGGVLDPTSGQHDYFPCPIVKKGDNDYNSPMEILVATRAIKDSISAKPAVWISGLKAFGRLWANISSDIGATYQCVKAYPLSRYYSSWSGAGSVEENDFMGIAVSIIPSYIYDLSGLSNAENAFSENGSGSVELDQSTDYFIVGFNSQGRGGTIDKIEIVFELTDAGSTYALGVYLYEKPSQLDESGGDGVSTYSAPNQRFTSATATFQTAGINAGDMLAIEDELNGGRYRIKTVDSETQLTLVDQMTDASSQSYRVIASPSNLLASNEMMTGDGQRVFDITTHGDWDVENFLIKFSPVGSQTFTVSNLQLRFFMTPDENLTMVYFDKRGLKDDASGTLTGTANELIENPSHVLEAIARQEMGYDAAYIDIDAFDDSADLLTDWQLAFQLEQQKRSMKLFGEIGKQSKSRVMFDEQNRLSMLTFNEDRGFPNAGTYTPEIPKDLDIFDEDSESIGGVFTKHPIKPLSLTVEPIGLNEVKNNFKLYYKFNYASGEFEEILFINHGNGVKDDVVHNITQSYLENDQTLSGTGGLKELTSDCYNEIGSTNTRIIKTWAIRDEETATKLLQYEVERRTRQLLICNFTTWENAVAHETGDYINIRHNRILNLRNEAWMKAQKWEVLRLRHDQDRNTIGIRAVEV